MGENTVKTKLIAKTKEKLQQVFKELNADSDLHNHFLYYNWKNEYRIDLPVILVDDVFVKRNKAPWEDVNKIKILQIDYSTRKTLVLLMEHKNNEKLTLTMDEIVNDYSNKIFS